ncbi:acyltransferase [Undibacterium sp. 14-3-2]|uniref:acyltransferase family protein n=1 Tax=Undibacterium sp. 14-3-2 TaxID=2800129 RepID=UPI001907EE11|nr:acyltransferase [Undibacterium sp. 14-3-2]MBK1888679.1 acyltransferase [Undibacterium sp. 14-3-2]
MKLSEYANCRENNFNLIRMIAAITVLINHCFPLLGYPEPFGEKLGFTLGTVAVDVFFITSGYLVTGSLFRKKDGVEYLCSRILRIYPALIFATCFSVFVIGACLTTLPLRSFFLDPLTLHFLFSGSTIIAGIGMHLPGVFTDRPFIAVNGSLWTLLYEIKVYLILLILWSISTKKENRLISKLLCSKNILLALYLVSGLMLITKTIFGQEIGHLNRFIFIFFAGSALYNFSRHIYLSKWIFFAILLCASISLLFNKAIFSIFYLICIPYATLFFAFVPTGIIRKFNNLGDYSYGTYIYAFPFQQSIAAICPEISVTKLALSSLVATLVMAFFSWHWIEKPILENKNRYISNIRKIFSSFKIGKFLPTKAKKK